MLARTEQTYSTKERNGTNLRSTTRHSCRQNSRFFSNGVRMIPSGPVSRAARRRLHSRNDSRSSMSSSSGVVLAFHGGLQTKKKI